ncbi:MAG TPA: hypothetical protein VM307_11860 [Egibacteraceae bacterium]|nr:hypothetical protein [Egibacteraceae bacterium]
MTRRALITAALLTAGLAYMAWGRPVDALHLPTTGEPEGVGQTALYEGRVLGDVRTGCLTLESGALVIWPRGFYAMERPARVVRPNGAVAVRIGEPVALGGGYGAPAKLECGTTERWLVSEVEDSLP